MVDQYQAHIGEVGPLLRDTVAEFDLEDGCSLVFAGEHEVNWSDFGARDDKMENVAQTMFDAV